MSNDPFPNQVPDIALPDLKKKKKERKKAGAAWGGGGNAAEAFEGATGGLGRGAAAAAEGAAELGAEAAAELAGEGGGSLIARVMSALSEFGATLFGKMVLALAATMIVGAVAVIAAKMMGQQQTAKNGPDLGGIASNIKVHGGDASGLDMAKGSGGDLKFGDGAKAKAAAQDAAKNDGEQAKPGEDTQTPPPGDNNNTAFGDRPNADRLAHNLSGAKLSDSLGGGFGSGNVFANSKIGAGFQKQNPTGFGKGNNDRGKSAALSRANMSGSKSLNLGRRGIRANRALGQLRGMAPLGSQMTTAGTTDEAAQIGTTQFEGSTPAGAKAPDAPAGLTSTTPNPTGGTTGPTTPPCTSDDPNACGITTPGHNDGTDAITQLVKQAHDHINKAITMLYVASAAALAMELIGLAWACSCCTWISWIFFAIAALIAAFCIAICYMMGSAVKQMADQIRQAGAHLGTDGQPSPQANMVADQVGQMGDDIQSGSLQTLIAGIGGVLAAQKVSAENDALQRTADSLEQAGVKGP